MAKRIEKYDLELIASEFEKIKKSKNGHINFDAFRFEDFITILQSAIDFNKYFPDSEKRRILNNSIFNCGKRGTITGKLLLKEINRNEGIFLNKPKTKYKLVTSISIKYSESLKSINHNKSIINFYPELPTKYDQNAILEKLRFSNEIIFPRGYTIVVISTEGRTTHEAAENAISTFELIRALWNFTNNQFTYRRKITGKRLPVNSILLGPIHTLHTLDGKLATDDHWYEILYYDEIKVIDLNKNFNVIKSEEKRMRSKLNTIPYGEDLKKIFLRYNNALDIIDYSNSIVNLWSILEYLTNTDKGYSQTISRTSFLYGDYKIVQHFLEALRDTRNKIVHSSERDTREEALVYQLKTLVENLLSFSLFNPFKFSSREELGNFLDLPKDNSALKKKLKIIKSGLKYKKG
ncbi:MAG: hypothetical protein WBN42_10235 [Ignavibacteriaceae bacterium]